MSIEKGQGDGLGGEFTDDEIKKFHKEENLIGAKNALEKIDSHRTAGALFNPGNPADEAEKAALKGLEEEFNED